MKSFSTSTTARIWAPSGSNFRTLPVLPALGCGVPSGFVVPTLTISPIQRADSEVPNGEGGDSGRLVRYLFAPLTDTDGGFEDEEGVVSILLDAGDNCRDRPGVGKRFVDGLSKFLHPFFELLVHVVLRLASGFCVIVMPDAGICSERFVALASNDEQQEWKGAENRRLSR